MSTLLRSPGEAASGSPRGEPAITSVESSKEARESWGWGIGELSSWVGIAINESELPSLSFLKAFLRTARLYDEVLFKSNSK